MAKKSYISFEQMGTSESGKTKIVQISNKERGTLLGLIKWHGSWRQYTFHPVMNTIFNKDCLNEISSYLEHMNQYHRAADHD